MADDRPLTIDDPLCDSCGSSGYVGHQVCQKCYGSGRVKARMLNSAPGPPGPPRDRPDPPSHQPSGPPCDMPGALISRAGLPADVEEFMTEPEDPPSQQAP